ATQQEFKKGNGEGRSFTVGYPIAEEPLIEISRDGGNFEPVSIGLKGLNQGEAEFYWAYQDSVITQEFDDEPIGSNDMLRITYKGLYPLVVRTQRPEEVLKKKNKGIG
ncbi:hypothetical protein, partial [Pseudomonas sp. 2995-1]|uniref:hypothetical protein n=1 Tax=Pseudomonas sp. 2995-1 TaxID=1712679 RepID=UPI00130428DB